MTTIAAAFEQYLARVGDDALPPGVDRIVVEKAFYCGAVKALEIVSERNRTLAEYRRATMRVVAEILLWMRANFPEGWLN